MLIQVTAARKKSLHRSADLCDTVYIYIIYIYGVYGISTLYLIKFGGVLKLGYPTSPKSLEHVNIVTHGFLGYTHHFGKPHLATKQVNVLSRTGHPSKQGLFTSFFLAKWPKHGHWQNYKTQRVMLTLFWFLFFHVTDTVHVCVCLCGPNVLFLSIVLIS